MKKKVRLLPSSGYLGAAAKWEVNRPKVVPSGPATPMEKVVFVRTQLILPRPWDRIQFAEAVLPWGEARGRECIQGDTRPTEQRSPRAKQPLPAGLRRFWLVASLLVGSQSAAALLPSSRLATSQNRQFQEGGFHRKVRSMRAEDNSIKGRAGRRQSFDRPNHAAHGAVAFEA